MDIYELYAQALEQHKAKNYDAALKILDEIHQLDPNYKKAYMLESNVWKALHNPFREAVALGILVEKFDVTLPEERNYMVFVLDRLGNIAMDAGLGRRGLKSIFFATKFTEKIPNGNFKILLSNVILKANAVENFSAEEFKSLYAEYEKILADIKPFPRKFYDNE